MKKVLRRTGMVILFVGAFYTTVTAISNVTLMDVYAAGQEKASAARVPGEMEDRQTMLEKKELQNIVEQKQADVETLEGMIDLEQYPSDTMLATGYTAGIESTGKTADHPGYGITYSGVEVKRDLYSTIAADLNVYPIGTVLYIPGYGYGVVADKGSAITGNRLDLYYPTVADVYDHWGKQEVEVYVVERGDGSLTEDYLADLNEDDTMQVFREQILSE